MLIEFIAPILLFCIAQFAFGLWFFNGIRKSSEKRGGVPRMKNPPPPPPVVWIEKIERVSENVIHHTQDI